MKQKGVFRNGRLLTPCPALSTGLRPCQAVDQEFEQGNIISAWNAIASPQMRNPSMCRCQMSDRNEEETLRSLLVGGVEASHRARRFTVV